MRSNHRDVSKNVAQSIILARQIANTLTFCKSFHLAKQNKHSFKYDVEICSNFIYFRNFRNFRIPTGRNDQFKYDD